MLQKNKILILLLILISGVIYLGLLFSPKYTLNELDEYLKHKGIEEYKVLAIDTLNDKIYIQYHNNDIINIDSYNLKK
jgi:hypothetical protein